MQKVACDLLYRNDGCYLVIKKDEIRINRPIYTRITPVIVQDSATASPLFFQCQLLNKHSCHQAFDIGTPNLYDDRTRHKMATEVATHSAVIP